ncbi:hypothetical protein [Streptomyces mobaraensis]|uniref:Uncharacterized protein n=1 Tax=Streptomyces mobaraensis TaxID=35621 RepID=A0A5N5W6C3_STRMB|nr:hypothetical protein [Streptomyces mobaraensis]KAB7843282.1 hypothetical protein FRZ00_18230 [Streptomyces mobaraensis]
MPRDHRCLDAPGFTPDLPALRETAARVAAELHDALASYGLDLRVTPEPPLNGRVFVSILDPLGGEEARTLAAALRAYKATRPETLSPRVAAANARSRRRDGLR